MKDEYGYDPEEDYTATDNPFWDATDGAHPAWWRGCDHGCIAGLKKVKKKIEDLRNILPDYDHDNLTYEGALLEGLHTWVVTEIARVKFQGQADGEESK